MKLSKSRYLIIVRIALTATLLLLITNAIFVLTDDILYLLLSMLSSTVALCFAFIMVCSKHKYTWKEVFGVQNEK